MYKSESFYFVFTLGFSLKRLQTKAPLQMLTFPNNSTGAAKFQKHSSPCQHNRAAPRAVWAPWPRRLAARTWGPRRKRLVWVARIFAVFDAKTLQISNDTSYLTCLTDVFRWTHLGLTMHFRWLQCKWSSSSENWKRNEMATDESFSHIKRANNDRLNLFRSYSQR